VVTNHHVLVFGQSQQNYQIITPDGQTHSAKVLMNGNKGQDLAILTFESSRSYSIAPISSSSLLKLGEEVFAAGFPAESDTGEKDNFRLNQGVVALFSAKPFGGGYEIGYTSTVKKGMSGGPLFNRQGEVIGLNGVHKYPLWGNPYTFSDGSQATPSQKQEMSQYSWAIPIQTLQQWLKR
jgi:S1-C subfamily serine protease